jgi:ATP-binding cassette subfamily C (CFTR/MRP) protein 1
MLDPLSSSSENIIIDGIGLHSVARTGVRDRIIAMSQDAVFLPGAASIKRQLDPFDLSTEAECYAVLQLVGLGSLVSNVNSLKEELHPESLSGGQRQLFNLARTVLRGRARSGGQDSNCESDRSDKTRGILLLDEVSSSVDLETERTLKRIIMHEFEMYTIVMVAHRLDMVMEFDTVLVMDQGQVVEQGIPRILAQEDDSYFGQLWTAEQSS